MKNPILLLSTWLQRATDPNQIFKGRSPRMGFFGTSLFQESADGKSIWMSITSIDNDINGGAIHYSMHPHGTQGEWELSIERFASPDAAPIPVSSLVGSPAALTAVYKDARKNHISLAKSKIASKKSGNAKWYAAMLGMFLIFAYVATKSSPVTDAQAAALLGSVTLPGQAQLPVPPLAAQGLPAPVAQAPAPQTQIPQPPAVKEPPGIPPEAHLSADELKTVLAVKGKIESGKKGKPFYVFSDPNCPHCRRLEASLQKVPEGFQAILIPVAYQQGSKDLAAKIMCSKDKLASWHEALFSGKTAAAVCAEGVKAVEENNRIFEGLRLASTPSFVSPGGVLFSGFLSPEQLANLVKN